MSTDATTGPLPMGLEAPTQPGIDPVPCDRCLALSDLTVWLSRVPQLVDDGITREPTPAGLIGAVTKTKRDTVAAILQNRSRWSADRVREQALGDGLTGLCMCSPSYPDTMQQLADPPPVLWVRGNRAVLDGCPSNAIAMVGTRRPTAVGRDAARRIAAGIARSGGIVVSGMALGVDAASHEGALSVSGETIAVLAGSAAVPTPPSNRRLYDQILERGAVVAEMPPGVRPAKWTFPARNRIIAALARATLVVEAPQRSGALITVEQAQDLGRDVFAVPGSLASDTSEGTNRMLCDGAVAVIDGAALVAQLGMTRVGGGLVGPQEGPLGTVHAALARGALSVDELGVRTGGVLGPGEIELALLDLELAGWISRRPDGRYRVVDRWSA